ncbi:MAG TPA: hypothetical protein VMR70_20820 [Flavisolibacter sp.]|nr:hypothetical protein [Flavisolibacter sp.]
MKGRIHIKIANFIWLTVLSMAFAGCVKTMAEEVVPERYNHTTLAGASARDLLSEDRFKKLTVEIQYMPGNEPKKGAVREIEKFLEQYLNKPEGIDVTVTEIEAAKDSVLSVNDIIGLENRYRTKYTRDKEIALYVLITNGKSWSENALGFAYRNTSVVLFGKHIADHSDKFKKPSRSDLQSRVMQHEFGHLLGLVNTGAEPQSDHQDHEHGKHCKNKWCLMYYLTDTDDYPSVLLKKDPPKLGDECIADLKAMGGK